MGIKLFFSWWRNNFGSYMKSMRKGVTCPEIGVEIDNLMIDMNGIFHNAAQKIYEYGNFKPPRRMLQKKRRSSPEDNRRLQLRVFEEICQQVEDLFNIVQPRRRLILCVDGPAPLAKQLQQRSRRFRSATEATDDSLFDSCSITPGTLFMDHLSKYIDWYIRKRITEDGRWQNVEVIFSNEKVPSEGEHKTLNYVRYYGDPTETYCINGLDADLFMLALATHLPKFYIIREDIYDASNEFYCIDIGASRHRLIDRMRWESNQFAFKSRSAINDFVFLCFMTGNDFLPHIPSIEIIENGIELIMQVYKEICVSYGHITNPVEGHIRFSKPALQAFLARIGQFEKQMFEEKLSRKASYFPDPLLESCAHLVAEGKYELDIDLYRETYCKACFPEGSDIEQISHDYLEGMQWVLSYYTKGVPSWKWIYMYHYTPPAHLLAQYMDTFKFTVYGRTIPSTPFQQLLSVLPPKSANLIPRPLNRLLLDRDSPLRPFCPDTFEVDLAGKRKEWEGIPILPIVDFSAVRGEYFARVTEVSERDLKRNITGKSFVYEHSPNFQFQFKSFYGDIDECAVKTYVINL